MVCLLNVWMAQQDEIANTLIDFRLRIPLTDWNGEILQNGENVQNGGEIH